MAHTNGTPNAYIELDFGPSGCRMDKVRVMHRVDEIRRSNGTTLQARDPAGNVIFTYAFHGITASSRTTDTFNMKGEPIDNGL